MYLRNLHVRHVKLLRDVEIDFTDSSGEPRMWTVFVGENRLCKTTLLQTIAAAASGTDRGTNLVADVVPSWPDLRDPQPITIEAEFGFSGRTHEQRVYPLQAKVDRPNSSPPPRLRSLLTLEPNNRVFKGGSVYIDLVAGSDPLTQARSRSLPRWFVAGYGPSRLLRNTGMAPRPNDPPLDRLRSLFGHELIGTGFIEILNEKLGKAFAKVLESVFIDGGLLPHVTALELRGRGGVGSSSDLVNAQSFEMDVVQGQRIRVPATWLSQGYQTLIAWLADVVGQILLETGPIEAAEMEGLVLIDEIDLHLHPTWQVRLIPALKRVFPRLQFIATTHSPMVLPALTSDEIFLLSQDEQGSVLATPSERSPALLTGSELLGSFFDIHQLYPNVLGDKTNRYTMLATDSTRTSEEDAMMRTLRTELAAAGIVFDWEPVDREADA